MARGTFPALEKLKCYRVKKYPSQSQFEKRPGRDRETNELIIRRFYHIHRKSQAKIAAASSHLQVKNCTKSICSGVPPRTPLGELTAVPQTR